MTSKNLFFRAMREDMCHKLWMAALSALGNFLVLVVGWMLWRSESVGRAGGVEGILAHMGGRIPDVLDEVVGVSAAYLTSGGGVVAMLVAAATGLASFRYVFHRNMTDTYHSLPIRRDALYGVSYLNGFLIWFIPFIVSGLIMFLLAGSLLVQLGGGGKIPELAGEILLSIVVLTVIYLLVYHVVLLAVMLSGNGLNTLFSLVFLGFGAIGIYGLTVAFFEAYMGTFYASVVSVDSAVYFSPLFAAPWLMILRMDGLGGWELWGKILISLAVALVTGAAAWGLYRRRASEVAGQGIWSRKVAAVFRILPGVAAGLCGWAFFALLLTDFRTGWGMFGAVLGSVFTFGILDILFQMDFKAFFAHKWQMAGTAAAALLICFAFYGDWFGYDAYLPDQGKIASISVYDSSLANRYSYHSALEESPVEKMCYGDNDTLYAFLERMTEHERKEIWEGERERVSVKVTLDSGRVYYRNYWMVEADKDVVWPVFTSEEYMKSAWLVDEDEMRNMESFQVNPGDGAHALDPGGAEALKIIRAYNRDVMENRVAVLMRQGKWLAEASLSVRIHEGDRVRNEDINLEIYDFMGRTREALEEAGLQPLGLEELEVEFIVLPLDYYIQDMTPEERVEAARAQYGVPGRPAGIPDEERMDGSDPDGTVSGDSPRPLQTAETVSARDPEIDDEIGSVCVSDPAEMEEVFGLLHAGTSAWRSGGIFGKKYTRVVLMASWGASGEWYIPLGALPEKYILRFGE